MLKGEIVNNNSRTEKRKITVFPVSTLELIYTRNNVAADSYLWCVSARWRQTETISIAFFKYDD